MDALNVLANAAIVELEKRKADRDEAANIAWQKRAHKFAVTNAHVYGGYLKAYYSYNGG
jgi:hypothetical protein